MQLTHETSNGKYQIRGYAPGQITVNESTYCHSLILTANELIVDWTPQVVKELAVEHFDSIAAWQPEVVLLGTGHCLVLPSADFLNALKQRGLVIEVMDTPAACRTFNILSSEYRHVAAALLIC